MSGQGDFYDRASVVVEAGRGGDGGDGGDVVLLADPDMRDLSAFRFRRHLRGQRGVHGEGGGKTGGRGEDAIVHVPLGTQVYDASGEVPIADLAHARARVVIARGGRGGRGNRRFTTAVRQAPRTAEVGEEGESADLELRLKMVCDAALLGFPNAGKSSLLRRISNATPKVADYPFTTLAPQLGTVELDDLRQLTVADVPGLLEGASDGVGLGHAFLAHLERAHALVHVVAIDPEAGDPLADCRKRYAAIYGELAKHGGGLADRPQIVVLNKIDLVDEAEGEALVQAFADAVVAGKLPPDAVVARDEHATPYVLGLSCATGAGVPALRGALERVLSEVRGDEPVRSGEDELADYLLFTGEAPPLSELTPRAGFAASLAAGTPKDHLGRSLGQLDLADRLLRYPCSFMVYSEAFDALPPPIKSVVYRRMIDSLSAINPQAPRPDRAGDARRAALEILKETKPDFPLH